ncbi:MAG TPA: SIS domain-containing protein [Candidatus Krumholzibacteria bacterium]|nr:SIS domain-containing protein [Candidatus Krumholzibacteria bacterium]HPD72731.1 SIS domain-containing protein [Candidatus Krumholzibacteria bacterium]HRY40337.1 SIS domain-containing protein [Candidatus Krumholzibacteria bacterium]
MTAPEALGAAAATILERTVAAHRAAVDRLGSTHAQQLARLAADILAAWDGGGTLLVCGNGGSAADSQHLAAELCGRYLRDRPGWPALALTTDTSALTAVANDYGFEQVFARQVSALGRRGDVLLAISTSGNSPNCLAAVDAARDRGLRTHGLLGGDGGRLRERVHEALIVPADTTPRIQELHITVIHMLCELLEARRLAPGSGDD